MGKRRIRNLRYLNHDQIIGCDISENRRKEVESKFGINTYSDFSEALNQNPDGVIISTPPDKHYQLAIKTANNGIPFFMEANIIPEGFDEVIESCTKNNVFYAPSCSMRFIPSIKKNTGIS